MKKWRIVYKPCFTPTPLSFWVHVPLDNAVWIAATKFAPCLPRPIPCKGYPFLVVNALGVELEFASVAEVEHFLAIIKQRNLPTSQQLSRQRTDTLGPNKHWLSRMPAGLKPWIKRKRYIPVVESALVDFKIVCG